MNKSWTSLTKLNSILLYATSFEPKCIREATFARRKLNILVSDKWKTQCRHSLCVKGSMISKRKAEPLSAWNLDILLTDRTSVSVMFQNAFQKWTSRFWVRRSNSVPLNSGSMAYFPEVKKELAATPAEEKNGTWAGEKKMDGRGSDGSD